MHASWVALGCMITGSSLPQRQGIAHRASNVGAFAMRFTGRPFVIMSLISLGCLFARVSLRPATTCGNSCDGGDSQGHAFLLCVCSRRARDRAKRRQREEEQDAADRRKEEQEQAAAAAEEAAGGPPDAKRQRPGHADTDMVDVKAEQEEHDPLMQAMLAAAKQQQQAAGVTPVTSSMGDGGASPITPEDSGTGPPQQHRQQQQQQPSGAAASTATGPVRPAPVVGRGLSLGGGPKAGRGKAALTALFGDDEDEGATKKRKLVPIQYSEEELKAVEVGGTLRSLAFCRHGQCDRACVALHCMWSGQGEVPPSAGVSVTPQQSQHLCWVLVLASISSWVCHVGSRVSAGPECGCSCRGRRRHSCRSSRSRRRQQ